MGDGCVENDSGSGERGRRNMTKSVESTQTPQSTHMSFLEHLGNTILNSDEQGFVSAP